MREGGRVTLSAVKGLVCSRSEVAKSLLEPSPSCQAGPVTFCFALPFAYDLGFNDKVCGHALYVCFSFCVCVFSNVHSRNLHLDGFVFADVGCR